MYTTERTPEDNPGVLVKLSNLEKNYGTSMYLMDKKLGNLYTMGIGGYRQIDEKGLLYPSESMIVAGTLEENRGEPAPFVVDSKIVESTRVPLKASTGKREANGQKKTFDPRSAFRNGTNSSICRATTRPPRPSSTAECLRLIARLRGEQASAASWEPRPPFEATEMD